MYLAYRTFETEVLQQLVNWAARSLDKSVNQPSFPHIVIVLNATDVNINERLWDPEQATQELLDDYKYSVHNVPALQEHLASLKFQGKEVHTTKELLECYYSSVTVVRIPTKGRDMQIDEQLRKLQYAINKGCYRSYAHKKQIRMLLNSERLPQYVNAAYDHFSQNLDTPFDFVEEARRHAPLPQDFEGHILNFIRTVHSTSFKYGVGRTTAVYHDSAYGINTLLKQLSKPIASCVILAAMRDDTQGKFEILILLSMFIFGRADGKQVPMLVSFTARTVAPSARPLRNSILNGFAAPFKNRGSSVATSSYLMLKAINRILAKLLPGASTYLASIQASSCSGWTKSTAISTIWIANC